MKDKYNFSIKENIFIAKKRLIDNIYSGARVEGLNVTFPETQAIVNGINVGRLTIDDILVIHNLKNAWKNVFDTIAEEITINSVCKINDCVSQGESLAWGVLRTGDISISGTNYVPPIPKLEQVNKSIQEILQASVSKTERAIDLYMYCCKSQLFWDGNKRTAFIVANKYLIQNGCGLITIKNEDIVEFNNKLTKFYDDNRNAKQLKSFLYDKCINSANYTFDNEAEK